VSSTRFLLDANLAPRIARFLTRTYGFDVIALSGSGLAQLPDRQIISLARDQGRVIITLDVDFRDFFLNAKGSRVGTIYLDLPREFRFPREINRILDAFFATEAKHIDLENSLVILSDGKAIVNRG
jgi:hypothetical protein